MTHFSFKRGELCAEQVPLRRIAEEHGTPCFVYSRAALEQQWKSLDSAFGDYPHTIYYAVKANSNIAVLNVLAQLGSGFDIVSEGELHRVLAAGGNPDKIVFSGVAKSIREIRIAVQHGLQSINVESLAELERVQEVAAVEGAVAAIALRVNPDVDPQTHPYISTGLENAKFGIPMSHAYDAFLKAAEMPNIEICGIACHIGSQITTTKPFSDALLRVLDLVAQLAAENISISHLDLGGGLGIDYQGETPPSAGAYVQSMFDCLQSQNIQLPVGIEPGRYIAGNSGVMLTRVEYIKNNDNKNFAIVDAGMNDLHRPSLYQAYHRIVNTRETNNGELTYDVVGPVCESADVLGHDRLINLKANDLLAVMSAGAYGYVMASNYNSRLRPPEILVDGSQFHLIRKRESLDDLLRGEKLLK